ncbi:MAG: 2OG-Fe dioxygenase family protein [Aquabacterium sp.]|nr:2OG-Fe dioxygenase family protein [Aquabacterium sp.]
MDLVPATKLASAPAALSDQGWALLKPDTLLPWVGATPEATQFLHDSWNRLPADAHLRDGGHYRFRRHDSYVLDVDADQLTLVPHRAHWQPVIYNALHGGFERWFEPIEATISSHPAWQALIRQLGLLLAQAKPAKQWFIEAHQFRVDTTGGIGRPTPEGAHRDGVDFVAVLMLGRHQIKGGETRVFEADGPHGVRFTLTEPWSTLLLDDERVIHESTPIQPTGEHGWRDTLVLTFRQQRFQGP